MSFPWHFFLLSEQGALHFLSALGPTMTQQARPLASPGQRCPSLATLAEGASTHSAHPEVPGITHHRHSPVTCSFLSQSQRTRRQGPSDCGGLGMCPSLRLEGWPDRLSPFQWVLQGEEGFCSQRNGDCLVTTPQCPSSTHSSCLV